GWRLDLTAAVTGGGDAAGHRTFEGDTCRAVADAAALVLAIMVNPEKVAAHPEIPPPPPPAPPSPSERAPSPPSPTPRPRTIFADAALFGAADFGTMSVASWGVGLAGGVALDRWRLDLLGIAHPYRTATLNEVTGVAARFEVVR